MSGFRLRVAARANARVAVGIVAVAAVLIVSGCSGSETKVVVRRNDEIRVMTPAEVKKIRSASSAKEAASGGSTDDTVPQNEDDRPVEQRILEAFTKFRACLEDSGETIRGNLQDPNNPAFKDPDYVQVLSKCAARTNIVEIFQEFQNVRKNLTPEQVKERNESFKKLQPCLEARGWTIETTTSDIGLIEPTTFIDSTGELNTRDIEQCAAEVGIDASDLD